MSLLKIKYQKVTWHVIKLIDKTVGCVNTVVFSKIVVFKLVVKLQ